MGKDLGVTDRLTLVDRGTDNGIGGITVAAGSTLVRLAGVGGSSRWDVCRWRDGVENPRAEGVEDLARPLGGGTYDTVFTCGVYDNSVG